MPYYLMKDKKSGQIVNYSASTKQWYWVEIIPNPEPLAFAAGAMEYAYETGETILHYVPVEDLEPIEKVENFFTLGWQTTDLRV